MSLHDESNCCRAIYSLEHLLGVVVSGLINRFGQVGNVANHPDIANDETVHESLAIQSTSPSKIHCFKYSVSFIDMW
jgi:hypothetical protein